MKNLFSLIMLIFLCNCLKNYIKIRRRYRRLWSIDYFYIILNSIWVTGKGVGKETLGFSKIIYRYLKKIYRYFIFRNIKYNYDEIIDKIIKMSPRNFELFCANLLNENKNYRYAEATEVSCDGGKDVIAKDYYNNKIYIECKHYREDNHVGRPEVQKLIGACVADDVKKAIFITTSSYSPEAVEYAKQVGWVELWTMKEILKVISEINKTRIPYMLDCLE